MTKEDLYGELGEIVAGLRSGRVSNNEITVFDPTGLSVQDVVTAWHECELAKEKELGYDIDAYYLPHTLLHAHKPDTNILSSHPEAKR